jgi:hypothetical protein
MVFQLRPIFIVLAVVALALGFYYNVYRLSSLTSRILFWISSLLTAATITNWGWWRGQ